MDRRNKPYELDEVEKIVNFIPTSKYGWKDLAKELGRTHRISNVKYIYSQVLKGKVPVNASSKLIKLMKEYEKLRKSDSPVKVYVNEEKQLDSLVRLDNYFEDLKQLIVNVIDDAVKQKTKESIKLVEKELKELRGFKDTVKNSNLVDMLRKKWNE